MLIGARFLTARHCMLRAAAYRSFCRCDTEVRTRLHRRVTCAGNCGLRQTRGTRVRPIQIDPSALVAEGQFE
jgi:hypothetical protein